MGYRFWEPIENVRMEDGNVYSIDSGIYLGGLSDIDVNLKGEEIVEIEVDD
jgi:sporulation protein YlmC with PRC-barrel domain